ncbi:MAG TPA: choice-of-anchor D domain-containing protein, partial [Gemmatimonadales bacterium]|nr:choice-of-anchor D domain-containing protein [Gemmatimonadales bacterium]
IRLSFTPQATGVRPATLTVTARDLSPTVASATVDLTGTGTPAAAIAVTPSPHDFGSVVVGQSSAPVDFTITNTGTVSVGTLVSLFYTGPGAADYTFSPGTCVATIAIAPGASCTIRLSFTPQGTGSRPATLTVTARDLSPTVASATVDLTGTGTPAAAIAVTPSPHDFGSVIVGQSSAPVDFTITNTGIVPVGTLLSLFYTGPGATDYTFSPGTCVATIAIAPGDSCTIRLSFTPQGTGARPATLTVTARDLSPTVASATVDLTGTGGAPAALTFTPASFDFGNRQVNTGGGVVFFSIGNAGGNATAPLDQFVFAGAAAADFSIDDQHCLGVSLAPGASCDLSVAFIPHATGLRSATLTASSSTGGATGSAQLSGTGVPPAILTVTPATKDFGTVNLGQSSPLFTFTLTNTGPSPGGLVLTEPMTGVGRDDYDIPFNECNQVALNVGTSCQFRVSFRPTGGGPRPATFTMVFQGGTATVNFTGFGTSPNALLTVSPDSQDFGLVFLGASSATKTLTVTNVGHAISGPLVNFLFSGPGAYEFSVPNGSNQCNGLTVAPGGSCTVGLLFTPQVYGVRKATLEISDGGLGGTVILTGGMTPGGVLSITPTAKNFGTVPVGSSSVPTQFTVTNSGTTIALVSGIFVDDAAGDDYVLDPGSSCASTPFIDIGASCSILVRFKPKRTGPLPATLYFYHDGGTVTADLTGSGGPGAPTPTVGDGTMELTAFTATDAARDLLGVATLTAAHRAYLDGTGNHNGAYDLGDLLAFFDRHHIKLSPALVAGPARKERAP